MKLYRNRLFAIVEDNGQRIIKSFELMHGEKGLQLIFRQELKQCNGNRFDLIDLGSQQNIQTAENLFGTNYLICYDTLGAFGGGIFNSTKSLNVFDISQIDSPRAYNLQFEPLESSYLSFSLVQQGVLSVNNSKSSEDQIEDVIYLFKMNQPEVSPWASFKKPGRSFVEFANDKFAIIVGNFISGQKYTREFFDISVKSQPLKMEMPPEAAMLAEDAKLVLQKDQVLIYLSNQMGLKALDLREFPKIKLIQMLRGQLSDEYGSASDFSSVGRLGELINSRYLVAGNSSTMTSVYDFKLPSNHLGELHCPDGKKPSDLRDGEHHCLNFLAINVNHERWFPVQNRFYNAGFYTPNFELYSDGAKKNRFFYIPPKLKIDNSDKDHWTFPKGSQFWKTFNGVDSITEDEKTYEVRLLQKIADSAGAANWSQFVYARQLKSSTIVNGTRYQELKFTLRDDRDTLVLNTEFTLNKNVPHLGMCLTCHQSKKDYIIGFEGTQLTNSFNQLSLSELTARGLFTQTHDPKSYEIKGSIAAKKALGYLHVQCGTCHSPTGAVSFLNFQHQSSATSLETEVAFQSLLRAGKLNLSLPEQSTILQTISGLTATMPKLNPMTPNQTRDPNAKQIISEWLNEL